MRNNPCVKKPRRSLPSLRAKRSNPESFRGGILDCFVASLLAMTVAAIPAASSLLHELRLQIHRADAIDLAGDVVAVGGVLEADVADLGAALDD